MAADKDYASTQAKTGHGIRFYFAETADVDTTDWVWVQGLKSGTLPSPDKPEIDVSNTDSTTREFIPGLGTTPDMSLEMDWYPKNEVHQRLVGDLVYGNEVRAWKLESPDFRFTFLGFLKSASPSFSIDAAMTVPVTLKVSSKPDIKFGDEASKASIAWDSTLAGNNGDGAVTGNLVGTLTALNQSGATFTTDVTDSQDFEMNTHYQLFGVPKGLTPKLTKTSGTVATLTFTGNATSKKDVSNITLKLLDAAFAKTPAAAVKGSSHTGIAITFV